MFYFKYYWILYVYCTSAGIFSLFLFIHNQCENSKGWRIYNSEDTNYKEYDFIVVGAGSAGSLIAARLAQDKKSEVLLVEAGGMPSSIHDIPITAPMLQRSDCDWQYKTIPQNNACFALRDRISRWPMGKIVGGTSRLNYMIYLRGHPKDFDSWPDWTWEDSLYYFKKSEHHVGRYSNDKVYHGESGPIYVSDIPNPTEFGDLLLKAGAKLGYSVDEDLNSHSSYKEGFMKTQVTAKNGARWSTDRVLHFAGSNLHIMTNAVVHKVLLRKRFEAYGVVYKRKGVKGKALARKAVVLSAGAVGTPKILMLSGIGPQEELIKHGINPKVVLPVGENLQDHITTGLDLVFLNKSLPISWVSIINSFSNTYDYILHGKGILTHPGTDVVGLFHTNRGLVPDIEIMALPAGLSTDAGVVLNPAMGISEEVWNKYFSLFVGKQVVTMLPVLLHPRSKGTIRLKSKNPEDQPLIDPKYLSHSEDIKTLIRGIRLVEKLVEVIPDASLNHHTMPGCERFTFGSDHYWECYIRHLTLTAYHPCCTSSLGNVVSSSLRVYDTNRLYVADASIMPSLTSGNINAVVLMIAEKASDLIIEAIATSRATCHISHIFLTAKLNYCYLY